MKLNTIILCTLFIVINANTQQKTSVSYHNQNILWYKDKKLRWPDKSTIHTTCWIDYFKNPSLKYKNNDCKVILDYINAIEESVYIEKKKKEYQENISKNKTELANIKASQENNANGPDQSMVNEQQSRRIRLLQQSIQSDENALAHLPDTIPINFPTDGTQKDKDTLKNAVTNLLPSDPEAIIKEITIIEAMLDRARNGKLYE
jgi:hypothetical protein